MLTCGIFIDDAGTPGIHSKSIFLPEDRKSFCAVIIPSKVYSQVEYLMNILLGGIKNDYGVDEVHCTDIYSNRGAWKKVSPSKRIEIFDFLTSFFVKFQLPVVFQTMSHHIFEDHPSLKSLVELKDTWWDYRNIEHLALSFLCFQTNSYLRELKQISPIDFSSPFPAFIDEGLVKAGSVIDLNNWHESFLDGKIISVRSVDSFGIQLADFAAFCIARSQWIMGKTDPGSPLSDADKHILSISGKLNIWNLENISVNADTFSRNNFEFIMMRDRKEKGLENKPQNEAHIPKP